MFSWMMKNKNNKTVLINKKPTLSAGFLLINDKNEILACHPTNGNLVNEWNIPKGKVENGEIPFYAALRELNEETGICLNGIANKHNTICSDIMEYYQGKNIILFLHRYNFNISKCYCSSTFYNKLLNSYQPEHDAFKAVNSLEIFNKNLQKVIYNFLIKKLKFK